MEFMGFTDLPIYSCGCRQGRSETWVLIWYRFSWSMIVASIEKLLYFRHSPPKMHQTHVCLSASHSSVLTLLNPTHIDRHTIRLSIMREFASKNVLPKKSGKWGSQMELRKWGKTELLVCFVLHSCCVPFSFFRIDALFLVICCQFCNSGSQLASMCKKLCARAWFVLVNRNDTAS